MTVIDAPARIVASGRQPTIGPPAATETFWQTKSVWVDLRN